MDFILQNELIPSLIFFIAFSVIFSLVELILALILNGMERKHWEFMIDVVIRAKVHHHFAIKVITSVMLIMLIGSVLWLTPLIDVIINFPKELKIFALFLPLLMFLIYWINVRRSARLEIEKKIYSGVFFIFSLILYIVILLIAQSSYGDYVDYVNNKLVAPTVQKLEQVKHKKEESNLLKKFRIQYQEGKCSEADYTKEEKETLLKNLLLIAREPELAFGDKTVDINNPEESLRGMACSDGEHTYLLVENGNWYWVSEEDVKFIETDY